MTTLVKRNGNLFPSVFSDFFDADRFFGNDLLERQINKWIPAVNIMETESEYNIRVAAPGLQKNDFKVEVENDMLTVSCEKEEKKTEEDEHYTRKEFSYSSFSRTFQLPSSAKSEDVKAKYTDGILTLAIPKKEEAVKKSKKSVISIN